MSSSWRCLPIALLALLIGCAGTPAEPDESGVPDWVLSTPEDPRYAYGVGSAPLLRGDRAEARRQATDSARSDLIQNLRVTVSGETRAWIERVRGEEGGPVSRGFVQEVHTRVPPTTLDEMEVAEAVLVPDDNTVYVLVRLDRPMATLRLTSDLNGIRNRLETFRDGGAPGEERIDTIRRLRPALDLIAEASQLEDQLRLVSTQPLSRARVVDSHAFVINELREALDSLRLQIDGSDMSERILSGLQGGLLSAGLRVGGSEPPDLIIGGDVSLRTVERAPDYFAFAEGRVVIYAPDGRLLGQFEHSAREGSSDPGLAEDRVLSRLGQTLGRALGEQLISIL